MKKFILTIALLMASSFVVSAQDSDLKLADGVKEHKGIDSIYKTFSEGYRTLRPELVANLYTEDAAYLSPDSQIRFGREPISTSFTGFFDSMRNAGRNMTIKFHIFQRMVDKNLGYDVGVFTLKYFKDGKMLGESKGKFVVVAIKGKDKKWRFQVDGYSDIKSPKKK